MQTECSADLFGFARVEGRSVVAGFDGRRMTSDAGAMLLGATDRAIVTGFGIWRIIFIGLALLVYTLLAFFWMKSQGASDALARSVAVNAITIGQVFYLLNSRYLLDSSLSLKAHMGNKYLPMGIVAVVVLQLLFTYTSPFQVMFGNEAIRLGVWPWLIARGLVFFLVVEAEKLIIRSSESLRAAVTTVEAGG